VTTGPPLARARAACRALATAAALSAGAACTVNPQFRISLAKQTYAALDELYVLLAKAELGAFRFPSSFAAEADAYAAVIGGFGVGALMAPRAGAEVEGAPDLVAAVDRCVGQVRRLAAAHRTSGVAPDAAAIHAVRASCDTAVRWVAASEAPSLILRTVGGDL
jgi:hypothetical protein